MNTAPCRRNHMLCVFFPVFWIYTESVICFLSNIWKKKLDEKFSILMISDDGCNLAQIGAVIATICM